MINDDYINETIKDATYHIPYSHNTASSQRLIGKLLSIVCYQRGQLDAVEADAKKASGPIYRNQTSG